MQCEIGYRTEAMQIPLLPDTTLLPLVPQLVGPAGEFAALATIDPDTVAQVCRHGYMPMGLEYSGSGVLLVKCHVRRCILDPKNLHVSKRVVGRARDMEVAVDEDFPGALTEIASAHRDSWLIPELVEALIGLHRHPVHGVATHSIEVYDRRSGERVAEEVGYTVGAVYTSLSGAHRKNGAGTVQLVALGELLFRLGYPWWDLGMEIEYKADLGARRLDRESFLRGFLERTHADPAVSLARDRRRLDAAEMVSAARRRERGAR